MCLFRNRMCDFTVLPTQMFMNVQILMGQLNLKKPNALKPTATYFGGSSLHGSIRFEMIFFCFALKKNSLQGMQAKILFLDTLKIM